jgi:hypothetical protein
MSRRNDRANLFVRKPDRSTDKLEMAVGHDRSQHSGITSRGRIQSHISEPERRGSPITCIARTTRAAGQGHNGGLLYSSFNPVHLTCNLMTGGGFFPTAGQDEFELDELNAGDSGGHAVQWVGTPGIKGPKWAKFPLLTAGMLGIQVSRKDNSGYDMISVKSDRTGIRGVQRWTTNSS